MVKYQVREIDDGVWLLRLDDDRTEFFEAAWRIPEGITYNSYLLRAPEGFVLIDTWKGAYSEQFIDALREVVDPRRVTHVVVNHAEPDHTGSIPAVIREAGGPKIVVHPSGERVLRAKYGELGEVVNVEGTKRIRLSGEEFLVAHVPWVHWPETIFTYQPSRRTLYTCDVFGSYSIPGGYLADPSDPSYLRSAEKYLVTVMGHYRGHVLRAVERVRSLGVSISRVAPSHGGVWEGDPEVPMRLFEGFARGAPRLGGVALAYVTMYGSVEGAVSMLNGELVRRGISVSSFAANDVDSGSPEEFIARANSASAMVLATPTYDSEVHPRMEYLLHLIRSKMKGTGKPAAAMVSYAWGSNAARRVEDALREAGLRVLGVESFRERPAPEQVARMADALAEAERGRSIGPG